eukprot:762849-Hanusia_phi.AAC.6
MTKNTTRATANLLRESSDVEISKFSLEEVSSDEELAHRELDSQEVVVFCHSSKLSAHAKLELQCPMSATVSDLTHALIHKFRDHNDEVKRSLLALFPPDVLPNPDSFHERAMCDYQLPCPVFFRAPAGDSHQHRKQHDSAAESRVLVPCRWGAGLTCLAAKDSSGQGENHRARVLDTSGIGAVGNDERERKRSADAQF